MTTPDKHPALRDAAPASCLARAFVHEAPLAPDADAARVFAELARSGAAPGSLLLESADVGGSAGKGSFLFPAPVLRLVARGTLVIVTALDERGEALLPLLAARLAGTVQPDGSLRVTAPRFAYDPALPDRERLLTRSVLDAVRALVSLVADASSGAPPIAVGGAFAYELVEHFEDLPARPLDVLDEPDLNLVLSLDGLFLDHKGGKMTVFTRMLVGPAFNARDEELRARSRLENWSIAAGRALADKRPSPVSHAVPLPAFTADQSGDEFLEGVDRLLEHVAAGDVFQAVLSRALEVESSVPPFAVYRALRADNPSPYMFFFELGDGELLGASPETCLRVEDRVCTLAPIAGTVPRGLRPDGTTDTDLDARLAIALLLDTKEQAEHAMLVDLARNDLARICVPGTREVDAPLTVERYSHVQHLVTRVRGRLDDGLDALDAYRATANMGTLTGAPKLRAMEILRGLEPRSRGWYGGAVGYLTARGDFDSCIVIRSLRHRGGTFHVRSGAGIVADSIPASELEETLHKARAPLLAIARAEAAR